MQYFQFKGQKSKKNKLSLSYLLFSLLKLLLLIDLNMSGNLTCKTVITPLTSSPPKFNKSMDLASGNRRKSSHNGSSSNGNNTNKRSNVKKETGTLHEDGVKLLCRYWKPLDPNLQEKPPRVTFIL